MGLVGAMVIMLYHLVFRYMAGQFEALGARMGARFDRMESRLDAIDRDVEGIAKRVFRDERD